MDRLADSYAAFLAGDPRRRGNALELGHDLCDNGRGWRVCWYEETGELAAEGDRRCGRN